MSPVDAHEVIGTGENSFMRLSPDGGASVTTQLSHWRVLWCPAGAGHTLFIKSDLTEDKVRIFSDNAAVTRWLQETIQIYLFAEFADKGTPITSAKFSRDGDPRGTVTETATSASETLIMTWYDCIQPFVVVDPPTPPPGWPVGAFTTMFPARSAQVELGSRFAAGNPWAETRDGHQTSSACLAWSETWTKPKG